MKEGRSRQEERLPSELHFSSFVDKAFFDRNECRYGSTSRSSNRFQTSSTLADFGAATSAEEFQSSVAFVS